MIKLPGWWTPREVANLYRVHTETVYRWVRTGKLPATRISRNLYRIKLKDVLALAGAELAVGTISMKRAQALIGATDEEMEAIKKQMKEGPPVTGADVEAALKAVREGEPSGG